VQYGSPELPEVLAIDEFKGNTGGEKYQCIITDPKTHVVLDILPKRYSSHLIDYFKPMDRSKVKYFVSDMWHTYSDFAATFLKNATPVIDKYHFIRQVTWAFEAVRKEEQKKFTTDHRKYFKRSKRLLTKRYDKLTEEQRQQVDVMLYSSANLSSAHFLKELFYRILDNKDKEVAKKAMSDWILEAQNSNIPDFVTCAKTFINWSVGILNSFDCPYTNGFTEGCNNKIKVLKRNAYGFRNFKRFRNRILHIFNNQHTIKMATA
jgi:transposase